MSTGGFSGLGGGSNVPAAPAVPEAPPEYLKDFEITSSSQGAPKIAPASTQTGPGFMKNVSNVSDWQNDTSSLEQNAFYSYSMNSVYSALNNNLRTGSPLTQKQRDVVKNVKSAIAKFELKEPIMMHRKSTLDLLGIDPGSYRPGRTNEAQSLVQQINDMVKASSGNWQVQEKAFTSSSPNEDSFYHSGPSVQYHINTPAGKGIGAYMAKYSHYEKESEFLFDIGSKFKIRGAYEKNGVVHINMDYDGK